jgi:protoporphyrinogen oxidase
MGGAGYSRREVLSALLGVPAAALHCDETGHGEPLPPGEIVFPVERRGHAVRDGIASAPATWTPTAVVIVGGGVAGLAAAWRLKRAGLDDFVLLEIDDAPGGTAKSGANATSAYPWGAHYITAPMRDNRALVALLSEMGVVTGEGEAGEPVVDEEFLCREPQERLFYRGRWSPGLYLHAGATADDLAQLARFRARMDAFAALRDAHGRRAFTIPVARASDDADLTALDRLSMEEWLAREGFNSPRLLWTVDYACRDDYGSTPRDVSAWAGIFYFASRIATPGVDGQPVITWPEGNGRLVKHLARVAGDHVLLATAAYDVIPEGDDDGSVAVHALAPAGPVGFRARHAIVATPQLVTKRLVRPFRESRPAHLDTFHYGAWLVANLTLRERPAGRGLRFAWDSVLYESPSLGYVTATHQGGRDHGPTVLTYYHPLADDDADHARKRLLSGTRDEWADAVLTDLGVAHPDLRALTTRLDVMRWGHAMVRPEPGFLWGGARRKASAPHRNLHFAHADLSGLALFEEAFDHGVRAAEEVLAARGIPFERLR